MGGIGAVGGGGGGWVFVVIADCHMLYFNFLVVHLLIPRFRYYDGLFGVMVN